MDQVPLSKPYRLLDTRQTNRTRVLIIAIMQVLEKMIMTMVEGFNRLEKKLDRMNRLKDCLDGDTLLDNCDLAQLLGVTQRTIARYREKGLIRYYQTDENGKNFYRSSEIQEFLRQRGKKKSAQ